MAVAVTFCDSTDREQDLSKHVDLANFLGYERQDRQITISIVDQHVGVC